MKVETRIHQGMGLEQSLHATTVCQYSLARQAGDDCECVSFTNSRGT